MKQLEDINIEAYIPLVKRTIKKEVWTIDEFTYDKENDCYICPANQALTYCGLKYWSNKKDHKNLPG